MKRYLILAAATLVALAACSKVAPVAESQYEISFQVANFATKANVAFTNVDFGTYAWHHAEDATVTPFITNEKVAQKGTDWKTVANTYYWPKTGKLDFISYSPYSADKGPVVTESTIDWKAYTVGADDLMYADKAKDKTENEGVYTSISGTTGVPTLFHHALAKLSFKVKAAFLEYTNPENKSKTTWEVTLKNATLSKLYNTGDLALTLAADGQAWTAAKGWVVDNSKTAADTELVTEEAPGKVLGTTAADLLDGGSIYVLLQALAAGAQKIQIVLHIKTNLPNGKVIEEDFDQVFDLAALSKIKEWKMNQNIIYTISIKPTKDFDPENHPDDPEDATITFDPAVVDWETVADEAIIQI